MSRGIFGFPDISFFQAKSAENHKIFGAFGCLCESIFVHTQRP